VNEHPRLPGIQPTAGYGETVDSPRRKLVNIINRALRVRVTSGEPNLAVATGDKHSACDEWPHICSQDVYDIQMALLRNHGYFARWVDVGPNKDPIIRVIDKSDRIASTIEVSADGLNWVIGADHEKPVVIPLSTRCDRVADAVVDELRKPPKS
jgi:hypothetical protein